MLVVIAGCWFVRSIYSARAILDFRQLILNVLVALRKQKASTHVESSPRTGAEAKPALMCCSLLYVSTVGGIGEARFGA